MTDTDHSIDQAPNPYLPNRKLGEDVPLPTTYYQFMRCMTFLLNSLALRTHIIGHAYEPDTGGVMLMGNHQSFLDPILAAMSLRRGCNFMARDTLFKQPLFAKLLRSLSVFPVKRGRGDTGALKEAMRRLKDKKMVMIFPEGTRSIDGRIQPFLPGAALLGMKAAEWTLPVLIEGAQEAWPKGQSLPIPNDVYIHYAPPIHCSVAKKMGAHRFVDHVREVLIDTQTKLRKRLGKPAYDYSLPFVTPES